MSDLEQFLSDPFHSCALAAYVDVARETGQTPPDSEKTRQRAYQYYEEAKRG